MGMVSGSVMTVNTPCFSADKIIPSEIPNFILRGAKLVTQITFYRSALQVDKTWQYR